ncbi:MAG: hypothetical protein ABI039_00100 [Vicinamibacterales bacterium]
MMLILASSAWLPTVTFGASISDPTPGTVMLRVRFGMKDKEPSTWDGKLDLSEGKVESFRGWRWTPGDTSDGASWTVATRRGPAQGGGEKARVAAGGKMPIGDNGFVVELSGTKPDTAINFNSAQGKHQFKLSELPLGKAMTALDGNLLIERVPVPTEIAASDEDEDYPTIAASKEGKIYLAYVSFDHGKDFQGQRERPATPESGPNSGPMAVGAVRHLNKPEDFDYLAQPTGGEQVFLRIGQPDGSWGDPIAVTDRKQEVYRPAISVDGKGRVWVIYSTHADADKNLDHGNWELMARSLDATGKNPSEPINISNAPGADFMPAAVTDSSGNVWVTWVGARDKAFNVYAAHLEGETFSKPRRMTESSGNEWEPSIATDTNGNVAIAWDTYEKGDYDVYLSRRGSSGDFEKPQAVAASLAFEVRPSLAYDKDGKLWIAWEVSGDQWGKDFGALKKQGIPLYQTGRSLAMRVLDPSGKWFTPPDVMDAMPDNGARPRMAGAKGRKPAGVEGSIAPCYPRLTSDPQGDIWLAFRGRHNGNWRVAVGSVWFEYVTRLAGDSWTDAQWLFRSNGTLDQRPAVLARDHALNVIYTGDGRAESNPPKIGDPHLKGSAAGEDGDASGANSDDAAVPAAETAATQPPAGELMKNEPAGKARRGARRAASAGNINVDLFAVKVPAAAYAADGGKLALAATQPAVVATPIARADVEQKSVSAMRDYRVELNGEKLRIWRGEFHRHTEYSPDGGNDGGLLDMWRYAIDAANLDWIGDGDHDYGSGREYTWWTTQKAVTLFTLPNHFVPMFCYERSVSYPEGHRNCMFAQRGVRSLPRLPITDPDKFAPAPDTNMLYVYLKRFNGICSPHTSATGMGTDWRNYDPEVEPFVEIYQGDRNNYERPDSPRSAVTEAKLKQSTPERESIGGWRPKGFVNLALLMGRRYAFQSSSDHISTHLSYCNVYVTEPTREKIIEAIKKKRVYGATDNIIADVRCKVGNEEKFMGEEFSTSEAPTLNIHLVGPQKFTKVTIIKDDQEVHVVEPNKEDVTMSWTDPKPTAGKVSYYYVRGEQAPDMDGISSGELVWASPMWIEYKPK